ncbi:MAG: serine/threonine protein kinase [Myxococcota bacterium]|nr:serine/threonine protein kinase [Myxococcota bacterium]
MESPERYGPYLVYEQIGKGGMATVHRAELSTKRGIQQLALKRLLPSLRRELVALFLDEARVLRYLKHPNIAATYDSGRVFGTYFIAMEYVRGRTLKELVEHCGVTVGSVPQPIALNLAAQLCDALDHAHNQCDETGKLLEIIHRDVTPANIIVSDAGVLKLLDFGLAKAKVTTEETGIGVIKGKYGYVAPEYIGGTLDHRADLWAIGIIMYELLTSRRLFDGPDAFETIKRVRELPIPRPSLANPKVTRELDEIVMTALERNPARRWQSAAAMRDRIRAVIAQPGHAMTDQGVADWVTWVFGQKRGRAPQLTPMMPLPIASLPGVTPLGEEPGRAADAFRDEPGRSPAPRSGPTVPTTAPTAAFAWTWPNLVWVVGAGALVVLLVASLIVRLVA